MESEADYRQKLGVRGEDAACRFLSEMGHTILRRNYRSGHLEIDIISFDSEGIHFVEVKTRQKSIQAPPQESVDYAKQRHIARAAQRFLNTKEGRSFSNLECMFDVVAVIMEDGKPRIEWIPQAYIPMYL